MGKVILAVLFCFTLTITAHAQKRDTAAYYMDGNNNVATTESLAFYIRYIYPPTPEGPLYMVKDYFKSGKPKFITHSLNGDPENMNTYQGTFISYFANGKKKRVGTYRDSKLTGEYIDYYISGRPYCSVSQTPTGVYLKECSDTSGRVIAENGNGKWIKYNENFTQFITGNITNGKEEGEWVGVTADSVKFTQQYSKGEFKGGDVYLKTGKPFHFTQLDVQPGFVGGPDALNRYLSKNIKYPKEASKNDVKGRVILTFVVDGSGTVTDAKILRGIGSGCDEEALRVINASPTWNPGIQNGMPVRVQYSIPIAFNSAEQIQIMPVPSSY